MASNLSLEDRAFFESILAKAEPYDDDDPIVDTLDAKNQDPDRMAALIAKKILEGKL